MNNIKEQIESNKLGINAVAFSVLEDAQGRLRVIDAALAELRKSGEHPQDMASWPERPVDVRCSDGDGEYDPDKVEAAAANLASLLPALHRYISEYNMLSALERCSGADSEIATNPETDKAEAEIQYPRLQVGSVTQEDVVTVELKKTKTHHKWIYRFKGEVLRTSERPDPFPFAFNYPCKDGSYRVWTFGQRPSSPERRRNGEPKTYATALLVENY